MSVLGSPVSRVEGRLKVTGATPYVADASQAGMLHAVVVSSTVAKGRVRRLRKEAALRGAGVTAVLDSRDVAYPGQVPKDMIEKGGLVERRPPMLDDRIHYAGQPIALVLAETLAQATEAAMLVEVDYDVESWRLTLEDGLADATRPDCFDGEPGLQHCSGDTGGELSRAHASVAAHYSTAITHQAPIEVPAAIAAWNGGDLVVHSTTRNLGGTRQILAGVFAIAPEKVQVVCPFVGGAFGSKGFLFDYVIMAAVAAKLVRRPVKLVFTRRGMFEDHGHRPRTVMEVALGADADGRLTAVRHLIDTQTSELSDFTEPAGRATMHLYATPAMEVRNRRVVVNTSSPCPMRGPGESSGGFAVESAMDELAEKLAIDPVDLRLRNLPDRDPMSGKPWSTYHLAECLDTGCRRFGWDRRDPTPGSMRVGDEIAGYGMACAVYPELRGKAAARATLNADGSVTVSSATHDAGHGTYSVMTQIAADRLGLPVGQVRFRLGNSDYPEAPPSGGSRTTSTVGSAVAQACADLLAAIGQRASLDVASPVFGIDPKRMRLAAGTISTVDHPDRAECWSALAERWAGRPITVEATSGPDEQIKRHAMFSFGALFVEVRFDPVTKRLRVHRYTGVFDVGRVLNPKQGRSQVLSGVAFGIGMALTERGLHDAREAGGGRFVTASMADYLVPVARDIPEMDVHFLDHPDFLANPMGARGLGEIGIVGVAAAIANAVRHATGRRVRNLPITVESLMHASEVNEFAAPHK